MPINVNDDDLDPKMAALPEPKTGCTQMTFGLIRFEISNTMRRLQYVPPGPKRCNKFFSELSIDKKEKWVRELHERLENQYLKDTDMSVPLYWVIATVSRLIMSKMWLMIYHPFQRLDGGTSLPQEVRDRLFITSLENVEYAILLEQEEKTKRWGWLFRTYVQWHAIAFMLSEMCARTKGPEVERAWKAIDFIVGRRWADEHAPDNQSSKLKGHLWKPLRKLMERARNSRIEALAKDETEKAAAEQNDPTQTTNIMNLDFGVDRLFPETVKTPDALAWTPPPSANNGSYDILPNINSPPLRTPSLDHSTTPNSVDVNNVPNLAVTGAQPFSLPTMSNDWLLNNNNGVTPTAFDPSFGETSPVAGASPLLPDGSVNWASWDDMVTQFGMDIDTDPVTGQQTGYESNFSSLTQWY